MALIEQSSSEHTQAETSTKHTYKNSDDHADTGADWCWILQFFSSFVVDLKEEELKNESKKWKEELRKGRTEEDEWKETFKEELKGRIEASIQGRLERNN